jgi:hypothetical protein
VFRLLVTLDDVAPAVWRRLLVPGGVPLGKLHDMFQVAMGWTDSHLHKFAIGDQSFGPHLDEYPEDEIDENEVSVARAIGDLRRFSYEYDFGDSWEHDVVVEDQTRSRWALRYAVCLDGQNACPPEDCGGPGGYAELLNVLADMNHEDYDELTAWLGGPFDATTFDLAAVNAALQHVR